MYKKISDYGIIGNLYSVALIGLDGSIDWLCLPHIDSPSVFGALLDDQKGGSFSISPSDTDDSVAEYLPDTNILITKFRTRTGMVQLTDFMPIPFGGEEELEEEQHELYRLVEVIKGSVSLKIVFDPQFDYARAATSLEKKNGAIIARGNGEKMVLSATHRLDMDEEKKETSWLLSEGNRAWLHLEYGKDEPFEVDPRRAERAFKDTEEYWQRWLERSETGRAVELGPYRKMADRSALVMKLLYYNPTGALAAAATTSLPEEIGGSRNWDYRYTWIRDTSFTLHALFNLGHLSETQGYLRWLDKLLSEHGPGKMQVMYGLRGEEDLSEEELSHLEGYKGSKPVRIGNGAAKQRQLDIYGEIMDAALKLSDYAGKIDIAMWSFLRDICDYVVDHWQEKDSGIWEVRDGPHHFVYSKVMCWVALDRGITIAKRYGFPGDLRRWKATRANIMEEVLRKGWNEKKRSFVQHYDTDALDASALQIPLFGFLPFEDFRVLSSIEAIRRELEQKGFLRRYMTEDGLPGEEGAFLLCTFWLIHCLIGLKRFEEAEAYLDRMERVANHLGLFAEEYDVTWREPLGNFPQAFTHIGYINSVLALSSARQKIGNMGTTPERSFSLQGLLLANHIVLNRGDPLQAFPLNHLATRLKDAMNVLRGAFFEGSRVAYEKMKRSKVYQDYLELSDALKKVDLRDLQTRNERLAFWINLYNVIVIHGVIALGIRDSIKEVRNFFKRVQYQIGDLFFTPDDIEHGILRGNRRPPNSLFKLFQEKDPRLAFVVEPMDPRIHFTLVCASSSCPPIDVYTAENLDEELTLSGKTFLNSGGVRINMERKRLSLSRIFKWYGPDFGKTLPERLRFIAPYLYRPEERAFLEVHAEKVNVDYLDYDWRLNRS